MAEQRERWRVTVWDEDTPRAMTTFLTNGANSAYQAAKKARDSFAPEFDINGCYMVCEHEGSDPIDLSRYLYWINFDGKVCAINGRRIESLRRKGN